MSEEAKSDVKESDPDQTPKSERTESAAFSEWKKRNEKDTRRAVQMNEFALACEEFLPSIQPFIESKALGSASLNLFTGSSSYDCVVFSLHDVKKIASILPILRSLRSKLAQRYDLKLGTEDYAELQRRSFVLSLKKTPEGWIGGDRVLVIHVFFPFRAGPESVCRYVEVGKELKPVFKLVCDDGSGEAVIGDVEPKIENVEPSVEPSAVASDLPY